MNNRERKDSILLLTNDDGFYSEGIEALFNRLGDLGQIFIVAPDQEQSATSLSLTLHHPLRIKTIKPNIFAVSGTPADCIYLAVQKILPRKPDLIISGINHGPNLGQQDTSHSGTVAGATQGTFLQIPSMAVSTMPDTSGIFEFNSTADFTYILAQHILKEGLPSGITLNVNVPPPPIKGIKLAKLGEKRYNPEIFVKKDPRNRSFMSFTSRLAEADSSRGRPSTRIVALAPRASRAPRPRIHLSRPGGASSLRGATGQIELCTIVGRETRPR